MNKFLKYSFPCYNSNNNPHDSDHYLQYSDSPSSSNSSPTSQLQSILFETVESNFKTHLVATLKGHSSFLFSLTLASNRLYTGDSDGQIRVWDPNPSSVNSSCKSDNNTVVHGCSAVKAIVALGDKLFAAHHDHKIRVWKIAIHSTKTQQNYQLITTLPTVKDRFLKNFSAKNFVKVRRHKKRTWVHHVDTISALALSKDGSFLYSVSWDRSLKMWRTSDFKCLESVQNAHDDAINAVVLSNDGFVYTGSADKLIKVWRRVNGEKKLSPVSTLQKHKSAVNALALSSDGSVLYSGDKSIVVWEKEGGNGHMVVVGVLTGHTEAILCLAVVSDLVCSGSADKTVRIWKRGSGSSYSCLAVFEGHRSPVKCLTAAANSERSEDVKNNGLCDSYLVYSGSLDFDIKVWQIWVPF